MKEEFYISKPYQTSTAQSTNIHISTMDMYHIIMTDEYEEDGKIKKQSHLYGWVTNLPAVITQAEIKGKGKKAKDNFIKNIIEAIQLVNNERLDHHLQTP